MVIKYCIKCKTPLSADESCCKNCGQPIVTQNTSNSIYPSDDTRLPQIIGPNAEIFLEEFKRIECDQTPKFHILAFLFPLPYCSYRNSKEICDKYMLLPLRLIWLFGISERFVTRVLSNNHPSMETDTILFSILLVIGALTVIGAFRCGLHFYEDYYEQCCTLLQSDEDISEKSGVSTENMAGQIIVCFLTLCLYLWRFFDIVSAWFLSL